MEHKSKSLGRRMFLFIMFRSGSIVSTQETQGKALKQVERFICGGLVVHWSEKQCRKQETFRQIQMM